MRMLILLNGEHLLVAKPLGFYLAMSKSFYRLAEFKIITGDKRRTITSGDCDKMIAYLQNLKKEKMQECNSNN